jgi:arylsulfatase A-like enzyme
MKYTTKTAGILVGLSALLLTSAAQGAKQPNMIVIMCDDLGYSDVGFNGGKEIPTPGIDRIANEGVTFTSAYVSYPVCGPSRAGFITGRYGQRFGFERNPQYDPTDPNMGLPQEEMTIAESLAQVGYHSGIIGKWHLGAHPVNHPLERGFDEFFGHLGGGHRYFPEVLIDTDIFEPVGEKGSYFSRIVRDYKTVETTKYLTDEFSDEAVAFVKRNQDKPFFLFLSYNAPHLPLEATEEYLARFSHIKDQKRRTYAAMVSAVDDGVGRLLDTLDDLNLDDDTIVFFLSDNGGPSNKNASDNAPLRGRKSDAWEGGFRVPMAARWPATFDAGIVYELPVLSLDILGTIAGITNAPANPGRPLDGVNLVPFVNGEVDGVPHKAIYLRKFDQQRYAVRYQDYKLVIPGKNSKPQLYNLVDDIGETNNLAHSNPEKLKQLDTMLNEWTSDLQDPAFWGLIHSDEWIKNKAKGKKK